MKNYLKQVFPKAPEQTMYLRFLETPKADLKTPYMRESERAWEDSIKSLETPYMRHIKSIEEENND